MAKDDKYMTNVSHIDPDVLVEIEQELKSLDGWGGLDIQIQNHRIVQMTKKMTRKT